jgi:excisionase family DNA binding protein
MSIHFEGDPKKNLDPAQWVSQADAAEMRGVTRQAIARLVKKGRFTILSIGGKVLLKRSEVEKFKPKPPGPLPRTKQSKRNKARR